MDATGFEQEFEALFTTAFAITRRLVGNVTDAEDAAAEAVARATWPTWTKRPWHVRSASPSTR